MMPIAAMVVLVVSSQRYAGNEAIESTQISAI
jgi:hypothetical protein